MRCLLMMCALALSVTAQDTFQPKCNPFDNFGTATPFDSKCPSATGTAKPGGSALQDAVKNNLCSPTPPQPITIPQLAKLEIPISKNKDYKTWDPEHEPVSRDPFQKLAGAFHETQLVQLTAYILKAEPADQTSGETVNCDLGTTNKPPNKVSDQDAKQFNDIHVALVATKSQTNECQSVTAEVIPHFRNALWTPELFTTKLKGKLVRVTGQLMYDASHKPCTKSGGAAPKRQSSWEIHPVYQVEVCTADDGKGTCTGSFQTVAEFEHQ